VSARLSVFASRRTFILTDVLECVGAAIVFPFHDADFAKGALADDAEEAKVVEVYCDGEAVSTCNCLLSCRYAP